MLGFIDFAGSTVVHSVGGWAALAGTPVLGPRLGKYTKDGRIKPILGHNMPLAALGVFILWLGWFGFNPGSTTAANKDIALLFVNTNLAAGIFNIGGTSLKIIGVQLLGIGACFLRVFPTAFLMFKMIEKTVGLRVSPEDEMEGWTWRNTAAMPTRILVYPPTAVSAFPAAHRDPPAPPPVSRLVSLNPLNKPDNRFVISGHQSPLTSVSGLFALSGNPRFWRSNGRLLNGSGFVKSVSE